MATSRLSTRRVEWRVQVGTSNKPGQGLVIFEASVSYIPDPLAAGGPRTAIPEPVAAVLDSGGYACTPAAGDPSAPGERGVALFTTDSLGEDGGDWTWTARPQLRSVNGVQMANAVPAFSFAVPAGAGSLDLAKVQKVPASPGVGTEHAIALSAQAQTAAADSARSAAAAALSAKLAQHGAEANDAGVAGFLASGAKTTVALRESILSQAKPLLSDQGTALADEMRWFRNQLGGVATEPVDILCVGDSTMEGARAPIVGSRWIDRVTKALRARHQPSEVGGGAGYRPVVYSPGIPFAGDTWTYYVGTASIPAGTVFVSDSFAGTGDLSGRATPVGEYNWTTSAGAYTLNGSDAVNKTGSNVLAYLNGLPSGEHEVTTSFKIGSLGATNDAVRVFAMSAGATRIYVEATVNGAEQPLSAWRLGHRFEGTNTDVVTWTPASLATPSGQEVTIKLKVDGLTVTATVNGESKTLTLTQAQKNQLSGSQMGVQVPGIGALWRDVAVKTVAASGAGESPVFPTMRTSHGLGLRCLDLGVDCMSAVTTFTGTAVDVVFTKRSAGGTLTVNIDGAVTKVNTNAATEARGQKYRVGGLTPGNHTLRLSSTTSAIVEGVMVYDGDETRGIRLWDGAHVGYNAGSFVFNTAWADSLKNLMVPDMAFLALGINDVASKGAITPTQFKAHMQSIIASIRATNAACPVVLHNSYERGDLVDPPYPWSDYLTALEEIAAADDKVVLVDLNARLLGWNRVSAEYRDVWDADKIHINSKGHGVVANAVLSVIDRL